MTEQELRRRRPVWSALSDLFLDTETRPSISYASLACLDSGYDAQELEHIWVREVSPVLTPNLMSIAGEWAAFDQAWLERKITSRWKSPFDRIGQDVNRKHWSEVKRIQRWLLDVPEDERRETVHQISRLIWHSLDADRSQSLQESPQSHTELVRTWVEVVRPLLEHIHHEGHEPPLNDILVLGQNAVDSAR